MNRAEMLGAAALLALAAIGVTSALVGDEKPLDTKEAGLKVLGGTMVDVFPDGGITYKVDVQVADGGKEVRLLSVPDYMRWKPDAGPCREVLSDGGLMPLRPWVRFPADASVGVGCQRVAQVVLGVAGQPDIEEEADLVKRLPAGQKEVSDGRK